MPQSLSGPVRQHVLLVLLALVVVLATQAPPAHAAAATISSKKAMWGPVTLPGGGSAFPTYRDLGVGTYEFPVVWSDIATSRPADPTNPDDPAYVWPTALDDASRESAKYGISLLLRVSRTPAWANGGGTVQELPTQLTDYDDFLQALARRYPAVRKWMIWEEPNRKENFALDGTPFGSDGFPQALPFNARQRAQTQRFAQLIDSAYGRLKQLSAKNVVIAGNTVTYGTTDPLNFIRALKLPNGKPPRMDMYGHNPFGPRRPDLAQAPAHAGYADFSDLDTLAGWLDRYLHRSGRNRQLPIFVSEWSNPTDVPSYQFAWHVTRSVQARWVTDAFRISRSFKRIRTIGWYTLFDLPKDADGRDSRVGLIDAQGRKKAAYYAFKRAR